MSLHLPYETIISSWNRLLSGILQLVSRHFVVESDQLSIDNDRKVARTQRIGEIFCLCLEVIRTCFQKIVSDTSVL